MLSILMQHRADVETVLKLPAGAFRPPPKVLSSLIRLRFRERRPLVQDEAMFKRIVQGVFTRRRKTLSNALLALDSGPAPSVRPGRRWPRRTSTARGGRKPCRSTNSPASQTAMYAGAELCYSFAVSRSSRPT